MMVHSFHVLGLGDTVGSPAASPAAWDMASASLASKADKLLFWSPSDKLCPDCCKVSGCSTPRNLQQFHDGVEPTCARREWRDMLCTSVQSYLCELFQEVLQGLCIISVLPLSMRESVMPCISRM